MTATTTVITSDRIQDGLNAHRSNAPQESNVLNRLWTVYADAMSDGPEFIKNVLKLTNATTFWAKFFYPAAPQGVSHVGGLAKNAKNAISIIGMPLAISKLGNSIASFKLSAPVNSALNIGSSVCSVVNSSCDAVEFTHAVAMPLPEQAMQVVKVAGPTATLLGSVKSAYDAVMKLMNNSAEYARDQISSFAKEKISQQFVSNSLSLVSAISFVALGALSLISVFLTPIAPALIILCLTVGTTVSVGKFFYDRVVDPASERAKSIMNSPHFPRALELTAAASVKGA